MWLWLISVLFLVLVPWDVSGVVYFKKGAPHVNLNGKDILSGKVDFSRNGRPFSSFIGVPFATIPGRFEEAQLITNQGWDGVFSATTPGPSCPQKGWTDDGFEGDEANCLILNVYVPMNNTGRGDKGYPVMVYIYGGAFMFGNSITYDTSFFLDEDVVIVTLNYRVGVFGFLSTGDHVIPGNNGMKDIVVGLQFVQENIKHFGGDPNEVTVFRESAGGAAVQYLAMSDTTKGLMARAISQIGSSLDWWAYDANPEQNAVDLATYLNCPTSAAESNKISSEEILTCLKNVPAEELNAAQFSYKSSWPANISNFFFAPTTEPSTPISKLSPFLSESPITLMNRKDSQLTHVPLMIGATEDEGAAMFAAVVLSSEQFLEQVNTNWDQVFPAMFDLPTYIKNPEVQKEISRKIKQFYFGKDEISEETGDTFSDFYSDLSIFYGVYRAAMETASRGNKETPVYFYQYAYQGPVSMMATFYPVTGKQATKVGHGDDVLHFFDISAMAPVPEEAKKNPSIKPNSSDEQFSQNLVRLWASFATHGKPIHSWGDGFQKEWTPISEKDLKNNNALKWYRIDQNPSMANVDSKVHDRMKFWNALWEEHFTPAITAISSKISGWKRPNVSQNSEL